MKRGKKYVEAAKLVDRATLYDVNEAVSIVKKASSAKFDETVEAHIRTGCDGRHADQQIRGAVVLPHGTGKTVRGNPILQTQFMLEENNHRVDKISNKPCHEKGE